MTLHWLPRSRKLYLNLNLAGLFSPIQGWVRQGNVLVWAQHMRWKQLLITFLLKPIRLFNNKFLKWISKLSFSTSFTYSLTPSTSNLVDFEVQMLIKLFTRRPSYYWGHEESWGCPSWKFFLKGSALRFHALQQIFDYLPWQVRYLPNDVTR